MEKKVGGVSPVSPKIAQFEKSNVKFKIKKVFQKGQKYDSPDSPTPNLII